MNQQVNSIWMPAWHVEEEGLVYQLGDMVSLDVIRMNSSWVRQVLGVGVEIMYQFDPSDFAPESRKVEGFITEIRAVTPKMIGGVPVQPDAFTSAEVSTSIKTTREVAGLNRLTDLTAFILVLGA